MITLNATFVGAAGAALWGLRSIASQKAFRYRPHIPSNNTCLSRIKTETPPPIPLPRVPAFPIHDDPTVALIDILEGEAAQDRSVNCRPIESTGVGENELVPAGVEEICCVQGTGTPKRVLDVFALSPDHLVRAGVHRGNYWDCAGERQRRAWHYLPTGRRDTEYSCRRSQDA